MIEELDDIIDEIMDRLGIFGSCDDNCTHENPCRPHAESKLKERIMAALEVEYKLSAQQSKQGKSANSIQQSKAGYEDSAQICPKCNPRKIGYNTGEFRCPKCNTVYTVVG